MNNAIAFIGFAGICSVVAFIAGAGFAYGKFTQRINTIEDNMAIVTATANEAKTTAAAAHQMAKEITAKVGSLHDDIKDDFRLINDNISELRKEMFDFLKNKK